KSPAAILILPLAALQGMMFSSLSMVYTSKAPSVNAFNYFFSVFIYPMFFFSGVFFPLSDLNHGLRIFAWCLPLTPAVYVTRHLISGDFTVTMLWCILGMIAATGVLYTLALTFMRRRLIV
ncbi:MAG: ABC transporter permease, partial [Chloroflexi bacterium]|nr:ABC transporter permease [Chloroflexota bacterium]